MKKIIVFLLLSVLTMRIETRAHAQMLDADSASFVAERCYEVDALGAVYQVYQGINLTGASASANTAGVSSSFATSLGNALESIPKYCQLVLMIATAEDTQDALRAAKAANQMFGTGLEYQIKLYEDTVSIVNFTDNLINSEGSFKDKFLNASNHARFVNFFLRHVNPLLMTTTDSNFDARKQLQDKIFENRRRGKIQVLNRLSESCSNRKNPLDIRDLSKIEIGKFLPLQWDRSNAGVMKQLGDQMESLSYSKNEYQFYNKLYSEIDDAYTTQFRSATEAFERVQRILSTIISNGNDMAFVNSILTRMGKEMMYVGGSLYAAPADKSAFNPLVDLNSCSSFENNNFLTWYSNTGSTYLDQGYGDPRLIADEITVCTGKSPLLIGNNLARLEDPLSGNKTVSDKLADFATLQQVEKVKALDIKEWVTGYAATLEWGTQPDAFTGLDNDKAEAELGCPRPDVAQEAYEDLVNRNVLGGKGNAIVRNPNACLRNAFGLRRRLNQSQSELTTIKSFFDFYDSQFRSYAESRMDRARNNSVSMAIRDFSRGFNSNFYGAPIPAPYSNAQLNFVRQFMPAEICKNEQLWTEEMRKSIKAKASKDSSVHKLVESNNEAQCMFVLADPDVAKDAFKYAFEMMILEMIRARAIEAVFYRTTIRLGQTLPGEQKKCEEGDKTTAEFLNILAQASIVNAELANEQLEKTKQAEVDAAVKKAEEDKKQKEMDKARLNDQRISSEQQSNLSQIPEVGVAPSKGELEGIGAPPVQRLDPLTTSPR
jgi:hypothetical protein